MVERAGDLSGAFFIRTLTPFTRTPLSGLKHLPKSHLLVPPALEVRISIYYELGG